MKIQFHRIDTNVVVGLLVREFCCSGTDVSAKVLAMYAGTRTPPMEPQWLAAGLSQCLGISDDTRRNVDSIYDFKTGCVKTECLHEGWQTSGSMKVVRMAFNLYRQDNLYRPCAFQPDCKRNDGGQNQAYAS